MDNAWLVLREQGAVIEEAVEDGDEDPTGDEKERILDEKAGLGSTPSSVAEIRIDEPKVRINGVLNGHSNEGLDLR